jgi:hypothetical protein
MITNTKHPGLLSSMYFDVSVRDCLTVKPSWDPPHPRVHLVTPCPFCNDKDWQRLKIKELYCGGATRSNNGGATRYVPTTAEHRKHMMTEHRAIAVHYIHSGAHEECAKFNVRNGGDKMHAALVCSRRRGGRTRGRTLQPSGAPCRHGISGAGMGKQCCSCAGVCCALLGGAFTRVGRQLRPHKLKPRHSDMRRAEGRRPQIRCPD